MLGIVPELQHWAFFFNFIQPSSLLFSINPFLVNTTVFKNARVALEISKAREVVGRASPILVVLILIHQYLCESS
jgi:hypothetical protein